MTEIGGLERHCGFGGVDGVLALVLLGFDCERKKRKKRKRKRERDKEKERRGSIGKRNGR